MNVVANARGDIERLVVPCELSDAGKVLGRPLVATFRRDLVRAEKRNRIGEVPVGEITVDGLRLRGAARLGRPVGPVVERQADVVVERNAISPLATGWTCTPTSSAVVPRTFTMNCHAPAVSLGAAKMSGM